MKTYEEIKAEATADFEEKFPTATELQKRYYITGYTLGYAQALDYSTADIEAIARPVDYITGHKNSWDKNQFKNR